MWQTRGQMKDIVIVTSPLNTKPAETWSDHSGFLILSFPRVWCSLFSSTVECQHGETQKCILKPVEDNPASGTIYGDKFKKKLQRRQDCVMGVFRNQTGKFCFNLKILTEDVAGKNVLADSLYLLSPTHWERLNQVSRKLRTYKHLLMNN